jgi:hypothetical protein
MKLSEVSAEPKPVKLSEVSGKAPEQETIYSPEEIRPQEGEVREPGFTLRPRKIAEAAYLSTKQQFPMMEKGFAITPTQAYMGMVTSPRQLGKRIASAEQAEQKIESQLEKIPPSERYTGMVLAPFGEAAVAKGAQMAVKGAGALAKTLGVDKFSVIPESFKLGAKAREQTADLQRRLTEQAGSEAGVASQKATLAEQRAGAAETTAQRQAREAELVARQLPGMRIAQEAGRFKPIAQTTQEIGDEIRGSATRVMDTLKARRAANAETLKQDAFGKAFQREAAGETVESTKAYKDALQEIDVMIRNPVTGLTNAPVDEVAGQLRKIRGFLDRTVVNETGEVVSRPAASFEGLETARRFLNDRAFGLPAEGYDAIGQQMAGQLAKRIEAVMKEFSPDIAKFLSQYKKDSEPLRVFQSKVGKVLTGEQLPTPGTNFFNYAAQDLPGAVFKSRENYNALVGALGNNRQLAESLAKRFFAAQLESKGSAKEVENFIRQTNNRAMLRETDALADAERYAINLRTAEKRGEVAKQIGETERKTVKEQTQLLNDIRKFESDLVVANNPKTVVSIGDSFSKKLLDSKIIDQKAYRALQMEINSIDQTIKDAEQAKGALLRSVYKFGGYGGAGTLAAYSAGKILD